MKRTEFVSALKELNIKHIEFSKKIGRHPVTVSRWGRKQDVPAFAIEFIEMMRRESQAGIILHALNSDATCPNGHNLSEYIGRKNGQLICSFCGTNVEETNAQMDNTK